MPVKTIVSVVGCKILHCSVEEALAFVQNLEQIAGYEPKINEAQVTITSVTQGAYSTQGFFSCIPWRGRFEFTLHQHGFHSHMVGGWLANNMQGGFVILPYGEKRCQLWHYEEYRFPRAAIVLRPGLRGYLNRAMHRELNDIEELLRTKLQPEGKWVDSIKLPAADVDVVNHPLLPNIVPEITLTELFEGNPLEEGDDIKLKGMPQFSVQSLSSQKFSMT